jgi:hypothetical protein
MDSVQETHHWHCRAVQARHIDPSLAVEVVGDEPSMVDNRLFPFPLFHAPIFGGWRNYVVLEVLGYGRDWHVGWQHVKWPPNARPRCHVQRLVIEQPCIRVLKQPVGFVTRFFGIAREGAQVRIRVAGEGKLGDERYPGVRLF